MDALSLHATLKTNHTMNMTVNLIDLISYNVSQ